MAEKNQVIADRGGAKAPWVAEGDSGRVSCEAYAMDFNQLLETTDVRNASSSSRNLAYT
jgi:hypothetical protein